MKRRRQSLAPWAAGVGGAVVGVGVAFGALALGLPTLAHGLHGALLALLVLALPINGFFVRRELDNPDALERLPPRRTLYASTALVWMLAAAAAVFVGLAISRPDPAPLAAPATPEALGGLAVAVVIATGFWLWARGLPADAKRAEALRGLYRRGTHVVTPRTREELRVFRLMAVFSSAGEEIAYRWFLLMALAGWAPLPVAIVISTAAFALAHLYQGWRAAGLTGAFGLAAAILTLASGSIWPAVLLHILWNQAVAGVIYALYQED